VLARHRFRQVVNLVNGSTIVGVGVALAGGAFAGGRFAGDGRLISGPDGLLTATGYRLAVPAAPAFTVGNVIIVNARWVPVPPAVFAHEARHATQYAWCGGLLMLPLYFTAAGMSWVLCGDFGAWNMFERQAGLADGGYADRRVRPALARALATFRMLGMLRRRTVPPAPAAGPVPPAPGPGPAGPGGASATPSR
jgi:hypothetical protein